MAARISVPQNARRGDQIEIRIAIQHPMETGYRVEDNGTAITKNVINKLVCRYNGAEVFRAEMGSGISANPYLSFFIVAAASGELRFDWVDDAGVAGSERSAIIVA
ncbi:MAG: thiosulfate oxidation carrier complex protein SoxZ [Betaproteobacteria bacterium]|jgi:sulfur-oxidizing protein SoxZ